MTDEELIKYWRKHLRLPYELSKEEIINFWNMECKPYSVRVDAVKELSNKYNINILIESGTYLGAMIDAVENNFSKIFSIELDEKLYQAAELKYSDRAHITIVSGDSAKMIPKILESIQEPCLFWLDGHYVPYTTDTARGELDTPIMHELDYILSHPIKGHVILIDDARCFIGSNPVLNDYPTIQELESYIVNKRPDLSFEVKDDIIQIYCKSTIK
ncbi:hypothetical protein [Cytobacillus firmus]|uniref:hypothetical protein n=1 Tax=Cytobacillus firmus TaxID=1399 RepID=UPI002493FD62|nr:hypothetical protein [Cytobacillus firmus]